MDLKRLRSSIDRTWDESIVERLTAYVRIPNKSPHVRPAVGEPRPHGGGRAAHGRVVPRAAAARDARSRCARLPGTTPLLLVDIPGELPGLRPAVRPPRQAAGIHRLAAGPRALGAGDPRRQALRTRRRRRRLRGVQLAHRDRRAQGAEGAAAALRGADRGLRGKRQRRPAGAPRRRSATRIGEPSLVVCLDAECGNYDQVWCTTSLRGNLVGTLRVRVLTEGVHSGHGHRHRADARFASSSSCSRASKTRSPATCCSMSCR